MLPLVWKVFFFFFNQSACLILISWNRKAASYGYPPLVGFGPPSPGCQWDPFEHVLNTMEPLPPKWVEKQEPFTWALALGSTKKSFHLCWHILRMPSNTPCQPLPAESPEEWEPSGMDAPTACVCVCVSFLITLVTWIITNLMYISPRKIPTTSPPLLPQDHHWQFAVCPSRLPFLLPFSKWILTHIIAFKNKNGIFTIVSQILFS